MTVEENTIQTKNPLNVIVGQIILEWRKENEQKLEGEMMENKKNTLGKVFKEHLKTNVEIKMWLIYLIFFTGILLGIFS